MARPGSSIEHVVSDSRECCRRFTVLHMGAKFAEGPTARAFSGRQGGRSNLPSERRIVASVRPQARTRRPDAAVVGQASEPLLQVVNVVLPTGRHGLEQHQLDIRPGGSIFTILRTNGAGKTTLANVIAGAVAATTGQIIFDGVGMTDCPSFPAARRNRSLYGRSAHISRAFGRGSC